MATANKEFNARIQLKHDTEANWLLVPDFRPLEGEVIIYEADDDHPYCRLKIGDGRKIGQLPFIDAGTVDGESEFIIKCATFNDFPQPGSSKKLYIDLATKDIYHYSSTLGYKKILNFTLNVETTSATHIISWDAGKATEASVNNNILTIVNGTKPVLSRNTITVVTNVTKGDNV